MKILYHVAVLFWALCPVHCGSAQNTDTRSTGRVDKFRQLEEVLPTPNDYRTASGAPGHRYWQQQIDYVIDVEIDDENQMLIGSEEVTYTNKSPDDLKYVWLQLDPNIRAPHSDRFVTETMRDQRKVALDAIRKMRYRQGWDGGIKISSVVDAESGSGLQFTIVKTMMRIDLPKTLRSGEAYTFRVDWKYAINNSKLVSGRTGYEFFEKDGNYIYEMAQWFPRACAYTDVTGWQHKQFLGRGEFTLDFGNYEVRITVPEDHVVASTGVLQNPEEVLSDEQRERLRMAASAEKPMFVITPDEASQNESSRSGQTKTWIFKAFNVRDFAFASSRKFAWDALGVQLADKKVMAMSYFPNEGEPLWSKYSTHAVAHTLEVYSRYTFDYPYPVAISVNGPVGGMEYPMICFNGPRPEEDGTYKKRTKYGLISVIIHEVGHNWFPMIVNSDERQWTWMDEGLNTFLQYLTESEWESGYPSRIGKASNIIPYMISSDQVPIMTNSESILQFGPNAYSKPATALNILRETIVGRELFDFAFKQYANRWRFKRPMPADFFRTMEDASGIDLDWFWRGWFYSTDHVDISVENIRQVHFDTKNPYIEKPKQREDRDVEPATVDSQRNKDLPKRTDAFPELIDFYNDYDKLNITEDDKQAYEKYIEKLTPEQQDALQELPNAYVVEFKNIGGLVMPIIAELELEDGTTQLRRIPAEIWRRNHQEISKLFLTDQPLKRIRLDPNRETADASTWNNNFPREIEKKSIELSTKPERRRRLRPVDDSNPMRDALKQLQVENDGSGEGAGQADKD